MKSFEASGRTVEEAISAGLAENGLSIGDVNVEILEEGSKRLFGLFGSREARVRLTLIEETVSHSDTAEMFKDSLTEAPAPRSKPARPKQQPQKAETAPRASQPKREPRPKKEQPAPADKPAQAEKPARARKPREKKPQEKKAAPIAVPYVREERNLTQLDSVEADSPAGIAQAFMKELTTLMGLEIDISVALDTDGHVFLTLQGDPQGILIGRRGETLDALQYLTSLKVNRGREDYVRVTIDSEGYREKREEALVRLANRMANRARKTGRRVAMEPMNPYERRIFHSALQAAEGIATHSEGEEPNRHIVITPVKENKAEG
ncbi:MAG TPA: KH domain-containing protein [Clostridiales bacterium]|jgi:spoIIIJ-associated protein|nr:KH domain-containing protein [Clostridiales bacterium]